MEREIMRLKRSPGTVRFEAKMQLSENEILK